MTEWNRNNADFVEIHVWARYVNITKRQRCMKARRLMARKAVSSSIDMLLPCSNDSTKFVVGKRASSSEVLCRKTTGKNLHSLCELTRCFAPPNCLPLFRVSIDRLINRRAMEDVVDGASTASDSELQNFLNWATQLGISDFTQSNQNPNSCLGHSLSIAHFPDAGGRGLGAARNLRKGELILKVPKSALLTRENVMNGDPKLCDAVRNHSSVSSTQVLTVFLLREMGKKKSSKWYPYLKHLPRSYHTLSTFGEFEMRMLQVDEAVWAAERAASKAEFDWREAINLMEEIQLKPQLRTLGAWLWASATISSRTLHIPWDDAGCLCPIGDLFNYAAPGDEPKTIAAVGSLLVDSVEDINDSEKFDFEQADTHTLRLTDGGFSDNEAAYCFYARENYKDGEQVLLGYGLYTNKELLEHYGFLLSSNQNDKVFISLDPEMNFTSSWPTDLLYIDHSGKPSFSLLSALRVWATPHHQRKSVGNFAYSGLQLSGKNETAVMKWLMSRCQNLLGSLPTTMEEDSLLLQSLDKMHCPEDIFSIKLDNLTLGQEILCFCEEYSVQEWGRQVVVSGKLGKAIENWKLAILWRLGYKKILNSCIANCSDIVNAFYQVLDKNT